MSYGEKLKKISDLEKFNNTNAVIEFGASPYAPNLLSSGITSAGVFMIENTVEINSNITIELIDETDPLYFANNIHIKSVSILPITISIPEYVEFTSSFPVNTVITIEQTREGGVVNIVGLPNVTINGVTSTNWNVGNKIIKLTNTDLNVWEGSFVNVGNILRSVINDRGVITDDYVHGEKGRVLYSDPERPLHKLATYEEPGFMDPIDKIIIDHIDLCPLIMHVETPNIHRPMTYSDVFESILYSEDLILPTGPFNRFDTWEDYVDFWGCPTGETGEIE